MLHTLWLAIYRICALSAILFSALLYAHYLSPVDSGFCAAGGGCEAVRASGFGDFGSRFVNIPLIGVLAFGSLFAGSLFPKNSAVRRHLHWPSALGGVSALGLIIVQALVIKAYCWMCLLVDGLGVALAFSSLNLSMAGQPQRSVLRRWAWAALAGSAFVLPLSWTWLKPLPPIPQPIRALYEPGKINVVEFADFQCPFCVALHPRLKSLVSEYGDRVHFVRRHMPLPRHKFASHAAKGAVCSEAQGKGEEMADKLFEHELREDVAFVFAEDLGLDLDAFRQCMNAESTKKRLQADRELLQAAGFEGLPTTYIGDRLIVGLRERAVLKDAFEQARAGSSLGGLSPSLFLAIAALLALGIAFAGRSAECESEASL